MTAPKSLEEIYAEALVEMTLFGKSGIRIILESEFQDILTERDRFRAALELIMRSDGTMCLHEIASDALKDD